MKKTALQRINEGIAAVKIEGIVRPYPKLGLRDVVVGQITNDELKKFFAFKNFVASALEEMVKAHSEIKGDEKIKHNSLTCPKCLSKAKLDVEHDFYQVVNDLFWTEVKETLSPENKVKMSKSASIGLYEGWKIAVSPSPDLAELLRDIVTQLSAHH